MNQGVDGLETF